MAKIFEDITLTWGDDEKVIKGDDRIMVMIAKIEEEITLQDLVTGSPKMTAVASGYQVALETAGFKVSKAEVYASLFSGADSAIAAVSGLLTMMTPPSAMKQPKKTTAKGRKPAAKK